MVAAIEAVKEGYSIKRAAEEPHAVPRTTLQDRISGRVTHGDKPGPDPYLNKEEEELVEFLEVVSSIGYGRTRKQVKALVEKAARD